MMPPLEPIDPPLKTTAASESLHKVLHCLHSCLAHLDAHEMGTKAAIHIEMAIRDVEEQITSEA